MSCAVGSCSHGTTDSVEKSGSSRTSWSALSFSNGSSSVGQSPAIVWVKIEPGIDMVGAARNFATGMILPRATPAWSGTTHSISSIFRAASQSRASSSDATPRVRSRGAVTVFFFRATISPVTNRRTAGNLAVIRLFSSQARYRYPPQLVAMPFRRFGLSLPRINLNVAVGIS